MSLNIKKPEAHRMARELAEITGESVTDAVTEALRERLERVKGRKKGELAEQIMQIAKEAAPHIRKGFKSTDVADMLYDEYGLPK
jgi:antitoxin VapB